MEMDRQSSMNMTNLIELQNKQVQMEIMLILMMQNQI